MRIRNRDEIRIVYERQCSPRALKIHRGLFDDAEISSWIEVLACQSWSAMLEGCELIGRIEGGHLTPLRCYSVVPVVTSRVANPQLCMTFIDSWNGRRVTVTLILYNEFQMPIGYYIHEDDEFYTYMDERVFLRESCKEAVEKLVELFQRDPLKGKDFAGVTHQHAVLTGYNRSFGHSTWNDTAGFLRLRRLKEVGLRLRGDENCIIGELAWMDAQTLGVGASTTFKVVSSELARYTHQNRIMVHVPIGFRTGPEFGRFYKEEVTAGGAGSIVEQLRGIKTRFRRIVLLGVRSEELWRKTWIEKQAQLARIVREIRGNIGHCFIMVDGLTAIHNQKTVKKIEEDKDMAMRGIPDVGLIGGLRLPDKICCYSIVDYAINQFGSGTIVTDMALGIPGVSITGDQSIYNEYSRPDVITREASDLMRDIERQGTLMDMSHIEVIGRSFRLKESAYGFINEHMLNALRMNSEEP